MALSNDGDDRSVVLFDRPPMRDMIEESIKRFEMNDKASVMVGDFLTDDIGAGYDLILASSIMLFAIAGGEAFFKKLKAALNPGGIVVCINEGIATDHSSPWDMVLGYLTYNMQGMPFGVLKGQIEDLAKKSSFSSVETRTMLLSTGTHDISILR